MVTHDVGKMSAALSESTQDQQSDKGGRSSPCHKKKKKDKKSSPKKGSPPTNRRRAMRTKKHKNKKGEIPLVHHSLRVAKTRAEPPRDLIARITLLRTLLPNPRKEITIPIATAGLERL